MKTTAKVLASLMTLFVACSTQAADSKPIARVLSIQEIKTDDPSGYATWVATTNSVAKAKLGVDTYIRVYSSNYDGEKTASVRAVIAADSVATLTRQSAALENDPALSETRDHLRAMRKLGARVLYQSVRFDGTYKGASVYSTLANVSDEAGYLKALDQLRALYDSRGFPDAKINAYRVMAGRTDHTHRITIVLETADRLAAMLDFVAGDPQMAEWLAGAAKYRSVVSNTTAHEITK